MNPTYPGGVWPVMLTPFTEENRVDEAALEKLVDWYIDRGVDGLFAVCQSSEMFFLSFEERVHITELVVRFAAGRVPVISSGQVSEDLSEQVREVETLANQAVWDNIPVEILYPTKEELASMDYRSKIEIEGQVRIVRIGDVDMCACCAPHVSRTGEVGIIKVISCDRHRGGCRMTIQCGDRALEDYRKKQEGVTAVSVALSAPPEKVGDAVLHMKEQMDQIRMKLNQMQASYLAGKLEEIKADDKFVCLFEEELDNIAVRNFVNDACERCQGICAAFVGTDEDGYRYIIGSSSTDVREFAKKLNEAFSGKGGGKPEMVQGSLKGSRSEIEKLFA